MRLLEWALRALIRSDCVLIRGNLDTRRDTSDVLQHREDHMMNDTARKWPFANQGEEPQKKPNLPTP